MAEDNNRFIKIANLANDFQKKVERKLGRSADPEAIAIAKVKYILLAEAIACGSTDDAPKYMTELTLAYRGFGKEHYPIPKFQAENDVEHIKDTFGIGFVPGIDREVSGLGG